MKYTKKHKRLLLIIIVLVIVTSMFLVMHNSHAYKELPKVKLKGDINKSGLAIMVESDYQTGEYKKLDSNKFPTDGYTLNRIKSGCVDKNGKDVDALTYNENDKTISIKTKQSVYCYLYYDNLFKGSGTEEEPYQINYIEDLVRLSNSVNKDLNTYANKNFILTRDLDFNENDSYMKYNDTGFGDINGVNNIEGIKDELTNKEGSGFISIGNLTTHFQGNFNGNNKKLDNIYEENKNDETRYLGLFGTVENSEIKDLTISGNLDSLVATRIGGLIGYSYGTTIIENCVNEVNANSKKGGNSVGGLIGDADNNLTIKNSINKGQISGGNNTGGLVGYVGTNATFTIENSHNEGKVTNEVGSSAGGLLGRDNSFTTKTVINNSYNIGEVTNAKINEGGLIGLIYGTLEINNSYNAGEISNTLGTNIGGLIGYSESQSNIKINNSYNKGTITSNALSNVVQANSNIQVAGFIGQTNGVFNINNSHNSGDIINLSKDFTYGFHLGGIISRVNGNSLSTITNTYNGGNIYDGYTNGGFIAYLSTYCTIIFDKCFNIGDISSTANYSSISMGGFISAKYGKAYILNSYDDNNMEVNVDTLEWFYSGGFIPVNRNDLIVLNDYYKGNMSSVVSPTAKNNYLVGLTSFYGENDYITINNLYNYSDFATGLLVFASNNAPTINNFYYKNDKTKYGILRYEKDAEATTGMSAEEMKTSTFVETLNSNVDELNRVGLEFINASLKGYTLDKWILGSDDLPILTRKIEDLSGNDNHGTSYAVKYDKEGITTSTDENHLGYIYAGLRGHDFGNNFTMVVKFKFNSILDYNNLFGNWETGGMGISIRNINGTMNIVDAIYTDKYYSFTKPYDFKENEWYTIILTYDGALASDNLKLYINGVLHDTINVTGNVKTPVGDTIVAFGGNPKATWIQGQYSYATYKEALIFDRALTEEKDHISENYKDDINVTNQDELLLWYKF